MTSFDRLHPALQHHIVDSLGWRDLRTVQDLAIAPVLEGENVIVLAPTAGGNDCSRPRRDLGRLHGIVSKTTRDFGMRENPFVELAVLEDGTIRLGITDQEGSFRTVTSPTPVEAESGGAVTDGIGTWCVGRGEERGQITHDARALNDEVRISAVALPPERFLFTAP